MKSKILIMLLTILILLPVSSVFADEILTYYVKPDQTMKIIANEVTHKGSTGTYYQFEVSVVGELFDLIIKHSNGRIDNFLDQTVTNPNQSLYLAHNRDGKIEEAIIVNKGSSDLQVTIEDKYVIDVFFSQLPIAETAKDLIPMIASQVGGILSGGVLRIFGILLAIFLGVYLIRLFIRYS